MPDIDIVKTGSISQDFAEQMKALVPNSNFEEQAKDVAQQIEAMTASPSSATQARLAAEQMEAFMANPGFQEHAAQFAEQMEAADPKLREQIAEKVEAMMANPTFRQQVQRVAARMDREEAYSESAEQAKLVAEQMEAMGVDLNLQDADTNTVNDGLVDRMVESLFDRAIDTAPRQQVDMDGATLGKTEQRPRRLEEMKKMAQVDASKSSGNSVAGTTANVVKAIVGAGILSLSWSYYYATMLPSLFFTLVMGFFCAMNYFFLGLVADKLDMGSYTDIWIKSFGAKAGILSDIVISLACFANLASYLIVGGDYLPIALKGLGVSWPFLQDRSHAIALVWLLILPLNFLKDLSILGYTSIVGTLGAVYTTGMLLVEGIKAGFSTSDWKMFSFTPGWFIMIPAVAFAFNGHFNAPSVYRQLADRSPSRWAKVTTISFSICTVVTLICGVSGYLMFGSGLGLPGRSNVLTAPAFKGMLAAMVAYLATTLSVSLGYPLNSQALRNCFDSLLTNYMPDAVSSALKKMNNDVRLNVVSAVLVSLSLLVALSTDNLGVLNSINGAVGGCLMIFVMPSMMYLKTLESEKGVSALQKALPMASIATGGVIGVVGTLTALLAAAGVKLA
jgi:amino acid permease